MSMTIKRNGEKPARRDRVRAHTPRQVNDEIDRDSELRVIYAAHDPELGLSRRIARLEEEWDIERWLEASASGLAFTGTLLGLLVNKKFFAIPCIVLPFLFQHAVKGSCPPPVSALRRIGVRTRREIDAEKYALKGLRGDFLTVPSSDDACSAARAAWQAATT